MNVVQVCPTYFPYVGGVETHVKNISERLAKKYDVSVFTTDPSVKLPKREEINGVRVRRFKSFAPNEAYYFSLEMLRQLRKVKSDIVHGHAYHAFPLFFSKYAQKKRFIVTPHYHGFGHTFIRNFLFKFYKPLGKKVLQEADKVICVSSYEKGNLLNDFKIEEKKIVVIPNGINKEEFKNIEKKKKNCKKLLYVGGIEKYKGIGYLVRALPKLDKEVFLEIVGKGTYKKELVKLVNRLGLKKRVTFIQDLSREELLKKYADADLFVLLSKHEAFGISVAEALASKTPCIVARTSALKEWVDDENCFGVNYPINVNELVKLINEAIGKEVRGVKLLDWADVVRELIEIYRES